MFEIIFHWWSSTVAVFVMLHSDRLRPQLLHARIPSERVLCLNSIKFRLAAAAAKVRGKPTPLLVHVLVHAVELTGVSLFFLCATGTRLYQFVVELAEFQHRGRKPHEVVWSWEHKHGR